MNDMILKVAETISNELSLHKYGLHWQDVDGPIQRTARAAVEVMREPTKEMLNAARDWSVGVYGRGVGNGGATGCWQAMIDAARK